MKKETIHKVVYELMSDAYECEGTQSTERTLGEIMGIMSMASEIENIAISEPKDHDGCVNCKWVLQDEREQPCMNCKHNYLDQWEKINE